MSTKVALITGAGHRLGAATANRLMNAGWFVLIHVRSSRQAAQELLEQAEAQNNRKCGAILQADLTVDDQLKHLVGEVKNHALVKENGLSGLVHNASFYSQSTFEETSFETFRNLNRLHMEAPYSRRNRNYSNFRNSVNKYTFSFEFWSNSDLSSSRYNSESKKTSNYWVTFYYCFSNNIYFIARDGVR